MLWGGCELNSRQRNLAKSDKIVSFKEKCRISHSLPRHGILWINTEKCKKEYEKNRNVKILL